MPDTSIPTKMILTGIHTLINFQLNFSTETTPNTPSPATIKEEIKFCNHVNKSVGLNVINSYRKNKYLMEKKDILDKTSEISLH